MIKILTFSLLTIVSQLLVAQTLQFSLIDANNGNSLEGVEVFSHEEHEKISYTDKFGLVLFDTDLTDTLVFF